MNKRTYSSKQNTSQTEKQVNGTFLTKKSSQKHAKTTWGHVADWYDEHLLEKDTYHEKVIKPNITRLLAAKSGDIVLDVPSGQGFFSVLFAEQGAKVIAVDIASELVELAKRKASPSVTYLVAPSHNIPGVKDHTIDKITMILGIQNIKKVDETFKECARVLKKGGELHIVMNHPSFRNPKKSSWEWDAKKQIEYRRVDEYLSESQTAIDMHPGSSKSKGIQIETLSFHRPLQFYFKLLGKNGFSVDKLEEWISHRKSDSGPRMVAENKAKKEFPLFLYLRGKIY